MLKIIFNTILGLVLIAIWLKFVDIREILATLSKVNLLLLVPVFFFMLLSPVIRAVRLKIFLSEIKKIALLDLIFLTGVAQMLNFFIPIRAGEVAKGVYLNTNYGLHLGKSVVWVFLDRFVDFLVVLLLATVLLVAIPSALNITFITEGYSLLITFITIIFLGALFLTYLMVFQITFAQKLFKFLSHLLIEKHIKLYFERVYTFFLESFTVLRRHPKDLALLAVITVLAYAADAAIWYFTFISLGVTQDYLKMYLGQILSALTYLIPAAPGYVGSAEASGTLILSGVFGIDTNLASAMIVLFHISSALFVLIFGLISVFSLRIDLGLILKKALNRS